MDKQAISFGIEGFTYPDLYDPLRLKVLAEYFFKEVEAADPALGSQYANYRQKNDLSPIDESNLIVKLAPHLGRFIARLFQIEDSTEIDRKKADVAKPIFQFKKNFVIRRAAKTFKSEKTTSFDLSIALGNMPVAVLAKLDRKMRILEEAIVGETSQNVDRERSFAMVVNTLMQIETDLIKKVKGIQVDAKPSHQRLIEICNQIHEHSIGPSLFGDFFLPAELERYERALDISQDLLNIAKEWISVHLHKRLPAS